MARASDSYTIKYEGFYDQADQVERIGEKLDGLGKEVIDALHLVDERDAVRGQLHERVVSNLADAASACGSLYYWHCKAISVALRRIAMAAEQHEKAAKDHWHRWGGNGAEQSDTFDHEGMADGYYAEALAAAAASSQDNPDELDADTTGATGTGGPGYGSAGLAGSAQSDVDSTILGILGAIAPTAAQEYNDRIIEAQFQALMEYFKDDPVMLEKIQHDYEAWKKARAEAAKLAELGLDADAVAGAGYGGLDYGSGGLGDSGYGLDDFSSDFGGGGGGGGLGDDWAGSDWASDMLEDNLDTEDFLGADGALDDIMGSSLDDAVSSGADAAGDSADLGDTGMFGEFGPQLASVVQSYGLQVALAVGGGVALYATREQTIEAAAHVAEFVSTKCKPAVNDVMNQVRGMAKKTRVNLSNAKSNVKAAVRGEEAGDLVG